MILNGSFEKMEEWTYIGETGASGIDYVVANEKAAEAIKMEREGYRTESNHIPLEVELETEWKESRKRQNIKRKT